MKNNKKKFEINIYDECVSDERALEMVIQSVKNRTSRYHYRGGTEHGVNVVAIHPSSRKSIVRKFHIFKDENYGKL